MRLIIRKYRNYIVLIGILFILGKFLIYLIKKKHNHIYIQNEVKSNLKYKIEQYGSLRSFNITIVAVYFKLNKSKHNHDKYMNWMVNIFASISSPLVLFCSDKDSSFDIQTIVRYRKDYSTTLYKVIGNHWDILNEIGHLRNTSYMKHYKNNQFRLDPQRNIHIPDL